MSASAAFTPGSWTFKHPGFNGFGTVSDTDGHAVAAVALRGTEPMYLDKVSAKANGNLIAAAPDQHAAAVELDRLMLVIESAVRNADPAHHAAVLAALKANLAAITKATGDA